MKKENQILKKQLHKKFKNEHTMKAIPELIGIK